MRKYTTMGSMLSATPRVLVVEDDPGIAETCRAYLARGGYLSKVAGTLAAAMEELARTDYSLVLLDISLPGGNVELAAEALQINSSTIHRKRLEWSDAQEQVA